MESYTNNLIKHEPTPTSAIINVTNQCNCACTMCFTHPNPERMTLETAKQSILWLLNNAKKEQELENLPELPPVFVSWFGGEPLLEYETIIKPIMLWCEENNYPIHWSITTNVTLLTIEMLKFFEHFQTNILYSIDGNEFVEDDQRPMKNGESNWKTIEPKLPYIARYPYETIFRSTVLPRNVDKLTDGYLVAKKYGFPRYFSGIDATDPNWTREAYDLYLEQAVAISTDFYLSVQEDEPFTLVMPLLASIKDLLYPEKKKLDNTCGLGIFSIGISPDGKLYGCQEHNTYNNIEDAFYLGDIYNGIDSNLHNKLLNNYHNGLVSIIQNEPCINCEVKDLCDTMACPSNLYRIDPTFSTIVVPFCESTIIWHKAAVLIMALCQVDHNSKFLKLIEKYFFPDEQEDDN